MHFHGNIFETNLIKTMSVLPRTLKKHQLFHWWQQQETYSTKMCELLRLSPKNINNMVSQHLISSNIASKASQGNLIIPELGSNSGG